MARKIQKRRYVFVFLATMVLFSLGLLMGLVINEKKVTAMENMNAVQNLDDLSLQLQFTYLNSLDVNSTEGCKVMNAALEQSWVNLADSYNNLIKYKGSSEVDLETVKLLERNDMLNNIRYWFLLKKAKDFCRLEDSVSVLFFFSDDNCDNCRSQSTILEHFKRTFEDRFILFHMNTDIQEPMVKLLLNQYGIESYPAIILEEQKFEGFASKEAIEKAICSSFRTKQPECAAY